MDRLKKYAINLTSMLNDLDIMLKKLDQARRNPEKYDADDQKAYRNSAIKSFEISYELFWKMLKEYLAYIHGISISSPKGVIHECLHIDFLSNLESEIFLNMVDVRNVTIHDYDKDMAEEISKQIPEIYIAMNQILERILNLKNH